MRNLQLASLVAVIVFLALAAFLYPYLPEVLASHWNFQGQADGFMSKFWFTLIFAGMTGGLWLLFYAIPRIDPLRRNISKFIRYYDGLVLLFVAFMAWIYLASALANLGWPIDIMLAVIPGVATLMFYAGFMCTKSKRNWFIGIRTPWSLSSDRVWEKTNKLGGRLFMAWAILLVIGFLLELFIGLESPMYFILFFIIPIAAILAWTTAYSYFEWKKEHQAKRKQG